MKRIFLTGASGCIGHYLAEALIQETEHELFFLVRNPDKLKIDCKARPGIHVLPGNLRDIEQYSQLLKTIDVAILAATIWGGEAESYEINVVKTLRLMELLDSQKCEQVIYFSTASILDHNNQLLKEAGEIGTDYIHTKYQCFSRLPQLAIASKITAVFPTLVFGGDEQKPYSHLSAGLPDIVNWVNLIRWFKADGSFHFIHGRDIATVICYFVEHPPETNQINQDISIQTFVLGNERLSVDRAVAEICAYFHKRIYFRIPLAIWLANFFIKIFRIRMADWDRFCLN